MVWKRRVAAVKKSKDSRCVEGVFTEISQFELNRIEGLLGIFRIQASKLLRFVGNTVASKIYKNKQRSAETHMLGLLFKDSLVGLLEFFESWIYLNDSVLFVVGDPHFIGHLFNGFKVCYYCWQVLKATTAFESSEGCVVVTYVEPKHLMNVYCFQFLLGLWNGENHTHFFFVLIN